MTAPPTWQDLCTVMLIRMDAHPADKQAILLQAQEMAKRMQNKDIYRAEFAAVLHKEMKNCHQRQK